MNMRKFLAAGAIASVALSSANAECVNGGFYFQGSFGMSMTKMKYKNDLEPQYQLLKKGEVEKMQHFRLVSAANVDGNGGQAAVLHNPVGINSIPGYDNCVGWKEVKSINAVTDATETSVQKRKGMFQFELGFGVDKRLGDAMIGIDVNFGKNFGNVKKKVKGLAYTEYSDIREVADFGRNLASIGGFMGPHGVGNHHGVLVQIQAEQVSYSDICAEINPLLLPNNNAGVYNEVSATGIIPVAAVLNLPLYDPDLELEFKCKNKFYVSIMPRIGMLLNPRTELYVTFGMKIKGDKYTVRAVEENKSGSKSVTKCIPSFGLGLRHTFKSGVFVKLEYNMNLKASKTFKKLKISDTVIDETTKHTLKNSSRDIKLGFGLKF